MQNNSFNRPQFPKRNHQKEKRQHRINEEITAGTVRVTGDGIESKVCSIHEALKLSREIGVDLVEIVPNVNPPVCKIIDYQKFLYEKKRKEKENKKNAPKSILKEIKMSPNIGEHDIGFKTKNAKEFLEDGNKIKVTMTFRGRGIVYKDQGEIVLLKFAESLSEVGKVEQLPKMEGKNMYMFLAPKKN
jgi:translation initiation factor IF-3